MRRGTLSAGELRTLVDGEHVRSDAGILDSQIQPASIDLSLSAEAYRLPGSTLPLKGERVRDLVEGLALEKLSLSSPTCLARHQVYLVRLRERCRLPAGVEGYTNSKSSIGRVDLATRGLCDSNPRYDRIPDGYDGELWIELIPRSFDVVVQSGDLVNQAIFFRDRHVLDAAELRGRFEEQCLLFGGDGAPLDAAGSCHDGRLVMAADLEAPVVGFVARPTHRPLVLGKVGYHRPNDFFAPISLPDHGLMFLEKDRFYILSTWERVAVPSDLACEMVPYDAAAGEFRAHYAGFFDPGWGIFDGTVRGARAVLEVRPHADDLILRHRQPICAMAFERLSEPCAELYGGRGNSYALQDGPQLSKHFKAA